MNDKEIGCKFLDWIYLAQEYGLFAGFREHSNKPLGWIKGGDFLD